MKVSQNTRCAFGLHKYEVLKQEDIKDVYGHVIGIAIISRCSRLKHLMYILLMVDLNK